MSACFLNWSRKGTVYMETGKKMTEVRPDDIMNGSNPERAHPAYSGLFPGTDIWKTFWVRGFYGISCFCGNRILCNRHFPVPETGCILETYRKMEILPGGWAFRFLYTEYKVWRRFWGWAVCRWCWPLTWEPLLSVS